MSKKLRKYVIEFYDGFKVLVYGNEWYSYNRLQEMCDKHGSVVQVDELIRNSVDEDPVYKPIVRKELFLPVE